MKLNLLLLSSAVGAGNFKMSCQSSIMHNITRHTLLISLCFSFSFCFPNFFLPFPSPSLPLPPLTLQVPFPLPFPFPLLLPLPLPPQTNRLERQDCTHTHTHTQEVGIYDIEIIFHHLTMLPLFQSTYIWIDLQNERISGNKPLLTSRDKHNHVAGTVFKSRTCHSEVTKSIWIYYASELFFLHENQSTLVTLQHTSHQIILGLTLFVQKSLVSA